MAVKYIPCANQTAFNTLQAKVHAALDANDPSYTATAWATATLTNGSTNEIACPVPEGGSRQTIVDAVLTAGEIAAKQDISISNDSDVNWFSAELSALKSSKQDAIDTRTQELISQGFSYSSNTFSLSANAQRTWLGMFLGKDTLSYPVSVSVIDNTSQFSLADSSAITAFYTAAQAAVKGHLDSGNVLKQSILDATTFPTVNAVTDSR